MQPSIFGIIGLSGQDRALLMERLIPELIRRGHRVGTILEDPANAAVDDVNRYRRAGAVASVITDPNRTTLMRSGPSSDLPGLISLLGDVTLVLAEGFSDRKWPKLEVYGGRGPLAYCKDPWLVAVAGPSQPRGCPTPWYHWDEVIQIANVIENAQPLRRAIT